MKKSLKKSMMLMLWSASLPMSSASAAEPAQVANQTGVPAARPARPPEDKEQLERRLASVSTLIEKSSAAKQIESSAVPEALALRVKARELRKQAEDAYKAGNAVEASRMLDQAAKLMFESVHLASPGQVTGAKERL